MRQSAMSLLTRWVLFWDILLAVCAGVIVFALLDITSGGVLISMATVAASLACVGLVHYLLWGRVFDRSTRRPIQPTASRTAVPPDVFPMEFSDRERRELLKVLQHTLAQAPPREEETPREVMERAAIRRELLDRLRMFGA